MSRRPFHTVRKINGLWILLRVNTTGTLRKESDTGNRNNNSQGEENGQGGRDWAVEWESQEQ